MNVDNPYAPPAVDLSPILEFEDPELAGRGVRFGAAIIDTLIWLAYRISLMLALGLFDVRTRPTLQDGLIITFCELLVFECLFFLLIHGYTLVKNGQTLGKKMLSIRIASLDGQVPPLGRVMGLRVLPLTALWLNPGVGAIFSLVDVLFITRPDRRCLHDLIAGTKVVKAERLIEQVPTL